MINWQKVCDDLPKNIYVFIRKALIFILPNNTNLLRWKKVDSALCTLCKANNQTQLRMLNNCPATIRSGRHTWGHNSILYTMQHYLSAFEMPDSNFMLISLVSIVLLSYSIDWYQISCQRKTINWLLQNLRVALKQILRNQESIKSIVTKI